MNVFIMDWQKVLDDVGLVDAEEVVKVRQRHAQMSECRAKIQQNYPHSIILALFYPQMDFADRWCWQQFGSPQGVCSDRYSEYPSCTETGEHQHTGKWQTHWWGKVGYDFGYNEYFFAQQADYEAFCAFIPQICFGELYDADTDKRFLDYLKQQ